MDKYLNAPGAVARVDVGGTIKTLEGQSVHVSCSGRAILIDCQRYSLCGGQDSYIAPINASNGVVVLRGHVLLPTGLANPKNNHLYFYAMDDGTDGVLPLRRCGEVDTGPCMPAKLFEPRHAPALAAYAVATVELHGKIRPVLGPVGGDPGLGANASALKIGRCASIGYKTFTGYNSGVEWGPKSLMVPVCAKHCRCSFEGNGSQGLPPCKDQPDDPKAGNLCTLCGPSSFCPGCADGNVNIELYTQKYNIMKKI